MTNLSRIISLSAISLLLSACMTVKQGEVIEAGISTYTVEGDQLISPVAVITRETIVDKGDGSKPEYGVDLKPEGTFDSSDKSSLFASISLLPKDLEAFREDLSGEASDTSAMDLYSMETIQKGFYVKPYNLNGQRIVLIVKGQVQMTLDHASANELIRVLDRIILINQQS